MFKKKFFSSWIFQGKKIQEAFQEEKKIQDHYRKEKISGSIPGTIPGKNPSTEVNLVPKIVIIFDAPTN